MSQVHVWLGLEKVSIEGEFIDSTQDVTNLCNLANHIFILLKNHTVYHGLLTPEAEDVPRSLVLNKASFEAVNIACNSNHLFLTTKHGQVLKCSVDNFDVLEEVVVKEDSKCCIHGYQTPGHNIKVKAVAAGEHGCLYVTENGQLWASGEYMQLGIQSDEPKRVTFFDKRFVESVACGSDFSLALVHKPRQPALDRDDTDTETEGDDGDVFVSSCPTCVSESLSTPLSQQSLTPDRCPLGLPVQHSSEEHYSSSTASKDNTADDKKSTDESTSVSGKDETVLKDKTSFDQENSDTNKVPLKEDHKKSNDSNSGVTTPISNAESDDESEGKKNEFFINTEAARQFLTRQLSWVSSYGGAGEELLVECAEASLVRPTRILKQNVSNMASLVYEGVKNVGDRVATLSRHMSGGSEDTNEFVSGKSGESFEELNCEDLEPARSIASSLRCDEFPWSSSADTSDRADESELGVTGKASAMAQAGAEILATELWSWGSVTHGQLGTGDTIKRHRPTLVSRLSGLGLCQVACGQSHALALTLDGRAFAWGANNSHQVTYELSGDQSAPVQILRLAANERARSIAAGSNHSIITSHLGNVYYLGKHSNGPIPGIVTFSIPCSNEEDTSQKYIFASGTISSCQVNNINISSAVQDLTIEQSFLEEALQVQSALIKQLHKQDTVATCLSEEISVYETLCTCYNEVVNFTALNVKALWIFTERGGDASSMPLSYSVDEHVRVYRNYLDAVCNVIAISGFAHIARSVDVAQKLYTIFSDIPAKKSKKSIESVVSHALLHPLNRLNIYKCMIVSLLRCNSNKQQGADAKLLVDRKLQDALVKWDHLWEEQERRKKEADMTRIFWEGAGRLVELLRCPSRRLIRESRTHPITLVNCGRFSSHWLVLLSDLLVHVSGSSHTLHPVTTLWVEPLQDTDTQQNALLLTMPEDSLILCTPMPQQKAEWIQALQGTINKSLHKSISHPPPIVRTATYQFTKNVLFRDATYTGRWSGGKLQGVGKMEWPDGRVYVGKFQMNQQNGFGRMEIPAVSTFEGQWKDGQQNGYGIMKYASGDVYEGYFKDGLPHGHGVHKQGHFTASVASVYIGEWVSGVKQGYGVMDDIITGEKYLGTWSNNLKHGCGLIVTLDGIYYEGNFLQDVLTGYGVMVFEDGTHYEGELKGIGFFNGKGTLSFLSGDSIEGTLYGTWNEGVKISGTFHKNLTSPPTQLTTNPHSFGKLCVAADKKWMAIFRQCYQQLGITEIGNKNVVPDTQKIWDSVAVLITNSHRETSQRPKGIASKEFLSMDKLDTIPQFGRDSLDKESYQELRHYLSKAFESSHHPLGKLLAEVGSAYTATYGGVRVHPLLLSHAVAELHSLTCRVYEVVRLLFPALPPVGEELLLLNTNAVEQESEAVSSAALLHPVLLPRVHSALFVLYALHNKQEDDAYWKRLLKWNKQPDLTLMAFLGIDQKFWVNYNSQNLSPRNGETAFSPLHQQQLFTDAVETLQQLKTTFSPMEKLLVIRSTFQQMTRAVQQQLGTSYLWTMDDLFPVFHFVVVRSQILQLGSEIHFIEDFMEPYLQNGELGIMFTTLKACYYQILQEKNSMSL